MSRQITDGEPVVLTFKFINEQLLMVLNGILARMLAKIDHLFLLNSLVMILRELTVNALKANVKRVYFRKIGLDIRDPQDYRDGMIRFRNEIIGDFNLIRPDIGKSDYFIKIRFRMENDDICIQVINNADLLPDEIDRIRFRIEKAVTYNDFTEAYGEIEDSSEGAGLGIVLSILLLKNMGVNPANFTVENNGTLTTTSITIPYDLRPRDIVHTVRDRIIGEIEGIPTFPEHIMHLRKLCDDPEASIDEIAHHIMTDPALSADVIKLSNSAGFFPGKRIESINVAVLTIGLKNLNAILITSNARRILDQRYSKFEQIWEHCNKTAFYARNIALNYRLTPLVENAFMGGLLHDLGKIVLLATDLSLLQSIATLVENRKIITSTIMEEISIGISHSTIGELISNKWNFPEYLIQVIKYHHAPFNAAEEHRDVVGVVYLANMLCGIEERRYSYYYLEESVLERFDLLNEERFSAFHEKLKARFVY